MKEVLIVGAGLSGLTAAHLIKSSTEANVTVIEKGDTYAARISRANPNVLCGVGGAGTVGGGKLCLPPASSRIWKKTNFSESNFSTFWKLCFAPFLAGAQLRNFDLKNTKSGFEIIGEGIYKKEYDSIFLSKAEMNWFVTNLEERTLELGINLLANCTFEHLERMCNNSYLVTYLYNGKKIQRIYDIVLLASGRSSAAFLPSWLPKEVRIIPQSPDLGLRFSLERLAGDTFTSVGKDVKLKAKIGDFMARTFCVCSGGCTTCVSMDKFQYYDGHFDMDITGDANLGLLVRSPRFVGYKLAALYCHYLKKHLTSTITLKDFVKHWDTLISKTSNFDGVFYALVSFIQILQSLEVLPENLDLCQVFLPSVDNLNALIETSKAFETCSPNLYVIGDASGISRGFVQSAWSANCACMEIVRKLNSDNLTCMRRKAI